MQESKIVGGSKTADFVVILMFVACMWAREKLETVNGFGMNKLRLRKKCYIALNYFANFWWMEKNNIDKAITILQKAEFWPSKKEALQFGANCNSISSSSNEW